MHTAAINSESASAKGATPLHACEVYWIRKRNAVAWTAAKAAGVPRVDSPSAEGCQSTISFRAAVSAAHLGVPGAKPVPGSHGLLGSAG